MMATLSTPTIRYVLVHPEMGIYLGECLGFGFWSKLDPVNQPSAVTFVSEADANDYMSTWIMQHDDIRCVQVVADEGPYASMHACKPDFQAGSTLRLQRQIP
jgi:hypothetical protein